MLGCFTTSLEKVSKKDLYFVSVPNKLSPDEVKDRFSQLAMTFADKTDKNIVYLLYGEETIKYDYTI